MDITTTTTMTSLSTGKVVDGGYILVLASELSTLKSSVDKCMNFIFSLYTV